MAAVSMLLLIATLAVYDPPSAQGKMVKKYFRSQYTSLFFSVWPRHNTAARELRFRQFMLARLNAMSRRFRRRHSEEPVGLVALVGIGKFGYRTRLPILDLVGLTDKHIAHSESRGAAEQTVALPGHSRSDADYVLSRRPDYILIGRVEAAAGAGGQLPVVHDLMQHPDFERLYEWDEELRAHRRRTRPPSLD